MKTPSLTFPLLLIIIGALWLLKSTDILPATTTLVAAGLVVAGVAVLVLDGINRQSVVSGPMLMYVGAATYAKSEGWLGYSPLMALGMVVLGCLLLLARSAFVHSKHAQAAASIKTEQ
ncbi:hypothetical protein [Snodgrassella sp. CFCC 13594]|uniref:hypothetical protein n=1 Tax=Snodgrassella sp. CFCC 13594 TaxID=1775559 RepID=UPI000831FD0B|nr:hypothetical protein [Snodgrassella sp. CFCC 13594]